MSEAPAHAGGRPLTSLAAVLLLAGMGGVLLRTIALKSITNDEIVHIPAGYSYLTERDFAINNEHPPLVKAWAALPLLAIGRDLPPPTATVGDTQIRTWNTMERFWAASQPRFRAVCFWTRAMMVPVTLALGWLVFSACRRRFGDRAALFAVALFCLEPTVLAHGRVVHTDVAAALAWFLAWERLWAYLRGPSARRALLVGAATGLALGIKFSLVLLPAILLVVFVFHLWTAPRRETPRPRLAAHGLMAAVVILLVVNASYAFRRPPLLPADRKWVETRSPSIAGVVTDGIARLSPVLPTYFSFGIYQVWLHNRDGHSTFLLGRYSDDGWRLYFPIAFALKTTLAFLAVTAGALLWGSWRALRHRDRRFVELLVPLALYAALAMSSQINIGIRHFLPVYPFLFVLGGAALDRVSRLRPPVAGIALTVLALGGAFAAVAGAFPDTMGYMNELRRGRPAWRYLADSNVEWGDDVVGLADFLRARGETAVRGQVAAAWGTLRRYGIEYRDLCTESGDPPAPTRFTAIGASSLNGATVPGGSPGTGRSTTEERVNFFAAYRARPPVAVLGKTIYVYEDWPLPPPTPPRHLPLAEGEFRGGIRIATAVHRMAAGQQEILRVVIVNSSRTVWLATARGVGAMNVRLGNHWRDASGRLLVNDDARARLTKDLAPGEEIELPLAVNAPREPGDYVLELDLLQEGIAWFGDKGAPTVRLPVKVE
ncbi:MAG: phospholipid carrier-dependent glycosyltransferase [Thermoanaerobaculia bacterium]|nr:phospholipid carrier-dependent glycosyltransferase [Thermoanaerobaculia bacterium]